MSFKTLVRVYFTHQNSILIPELQTPNIFVFSVKKPFSCRNGYHRVNDKCEGQHYSYRFTRDLNQIFVCIDNYCNNRSSTIEALARDANVQYIHFVSCGWHRINILEVFRSRLAQQERDLDTHLFYVDIDECQNGVSCDDPNAICSNTIGGYHCRSCKLGFKYDGNRCAGKSVSPQPQAHDQHYIGPRFSKHQWNNCMECIKKSLEVQKRTT